MTSAKKPTETLGTYIKQEREKQHLSLSHFSELARIPRSNMQRIEAGVVQHPRADVLQRVANTLGIPVVDLFRHVSYTAEASLPPYRSYLESRYMRLSPEAIDELEIYFQSVAEREGIRYDEPLREPGNPNNKH
ncbi:helix-turn-helix domain-containing protein [Gryllotalpicola reticulitermitis]|uniref:Helix-turn-helix domain-containing protein n=1 Tax=Gryllotalpicola reticulitermitis TaxID=1184153 RepID=A0ABV8QAC4_9MICO